MSEGELIEAPAAEAPAETDWRDAFADGDAKLRAHLNRYADERAAWHSARSEAVAVRRQLAQLQASRPVVPETPEGYIDHLPEELIGKAKAALPELVPMIEQAHAAGLPADRFGELVAAKLKQLQDIEDAISQQDAEHRQAAEDDLRGEWGPEYQQNINAISVMFGTRGTQELFDAIAGARMANGRWLADDPCLLKFLAGIARELHPDANIIMTPTSGLSRSQSIESELEALELEMRDTKARQPGSYWANPGKQKRYAELIAAQERMNGRR